MASDALINLVFVIIGGLIGFLASYFIAISSQKREWKKECTKDMYVPLKIEIEQNKSAYLSKVNNTFNVDKLRDQVWREIRKKGYDLILEKNVSQDIRNYYKDLSEYNRLIDETGDISSTVWEMSIEYIGSFKRTIDEIDSTLSNQLMNLFINSLRFKRLLNEKDNKKQSEYILKNDPKFNEHMEVLNEYFPNLNDYYRELDVNNYSAKFLELRTKLQADSDQLIKKLNEIITSAFK